MTSSGLTTSAEALVRYYVFYAFPVFNILTVVFIHLTHSDRLEFLILIRTCTEAPVPFVLSNASYVAFEYCFIEVPFVLHSRKPSFDWGGCLVFILLCQSYLVEVRSTDLPGPARLFQLDFSRAGGCL